MSEYQTDNKAALANAAPLFASSWLALFYLLRENFNERRTPVELGTHSKLINGEMAESSKTD